MRTKGNPLAYVADLDWLGVFVASWLLPFLLDGVHRLTYWSSLTFWYVPTLLLLPRFLRYTDPGGRRRTALAATVVAIVALGVLLDCVFGRLILQFDDSLPTPYVGWLSIPAAGVHVPLEEFIFYAMAPIAILLVYTWLDEYWLVRYAPREERQTVAGVVLGLSPLVLTGAAALEVIGIAVYRYHHSGAGIFPAYFTFLVVLAFAPATLLFDRIAPLVNWRAFALCTMYLLLTSLVWEATLAVPRHWWGYRPAAMLGINVDAWTRDITWPFPLEALMVWFACPFSCILTYELVRALKYRANPSKQTFTSPEVRAMLSGMDWHTSEAGRSSEDPATAADRR